ncbi:MAG: hypothetical protein ACYDG2_25145 [Ruminiclostridium sp.]
MIFYCVVSEFYDNGRVATWITNHAGAKDRNDLPKNRMETRKNKDVYFDFFIDKSKAIKFCDDAKNA